MNYRKMVQSFGFAWQGIFQALKSEQNMQIHVALSVLAIGIGIFLSLTPIGWALVSFAIFSVLSAELWNTALEKLCNYSCKNETIQEIGLIKDIAAGAVLLSAINALVIGIIILIVPFIRKILQLLPFIR